MMEDGTLKPVWKHAYELALKQGLEPDYGYLKTLNRRCGMLLYERLGEGRHRIFAHPMVEENGALKSIPPFVWYFEVNALGQARDMDGDGGGYLKIAVNPQDVDPEQVRVAANTLRVYLDIALYTLSLLNCRNVELVEREANPKRRRTENRPRGKKYYVLGVKAFSTRAKRETAQEPGYKVRHHFRRGHFRDYTQGAGLFGKYPGVYWFGPASVGAVDLGEIHKDYDFKK